MKNVGGRKSTRDDDDYVLRILDLRIRHGAAGAARMIDLKSEKVRTICNRIFNEDVKCSVIDGLETEDQVMAGYGFAQNHE